MVIESPTAEHSFSYADFLFLSRTTKPKHTVISGLNVFLLQYMQHTNRVFISGIELIPFHELCEHGSLSSVYKCLSL